MQSTNRAHGDRAFQTATAHGAARHKNPSAHAGSSSPPAITKWRSPQSAVGLSSWKQLVQNHSCAYVISHIGDEAKQNSSVSIQEKYKQWNPRYVWAALLPSRSTKQTAYEAWNTWLTLKQGSWVFMYTEQPRTPRHGWILFWLSGNMADTSYMIAVASVKHCNSKQIVLPAMKS